MTSDEENREHRRGQQAGAKADALTAFLVACDPFQSEHYRQGFNSAYAEKHGAPPPRLGRQVSAASGGGGGGGGIGGDLPDSLGWIFALCLFVVLAPIGLALWLFRRWQRVLIGSAYLSWYYLAAWADRHGAPHSAHSYIVGWCYLICPLIACAIGDAKHRPLIGFLLGLFLQPVGIVIIAFLPEKPVETDDDRDSGVVTIIGRVLALVSLLIACFMVWRFEPGLRPAARTSATQGAPAAPMALGRWRILSYGSNTGNVSWQYALSGNDRVLQATGGTQHGGGNSIAITDRDIGDGVVSAEVRPAAAFNAGHHTGIVARLTDPGNTYELFVNQISRSLILSSWENGREVRLGTRPLPAAWFGGWIRLSLELHGSRLTGAANGRVLLSVANAAHSRGRAGLINAGGISQYRGFVERAARLGVVPFE
jgi:hypothetical protein